MGKFQFIIILLFFQLLTIIFSQEERELIFVYEHVRHGARGPSSGFNSYLVDGVDEYGVNWTYDGELSPIGKRQHYFLGLRNRERYRKFMDDFKTYDPQAILIHATNYNRTHQSINAELKAMYELTKEPQLSPDEQKNYNMTNLNYMKTSNPTLRERIMGELSKLGPKQNKYETPVFNIRSFPSGRIFLVDSCDKIKQYRDERVGKDVEAYYNEFARVFQENFTHFFNHPEYFRDYDKMKSITDHFICDYDNKVNLSHIAKYLDLDKFYDFSRRFYGSFIFDYFVDQYTSGLEETHLMKDLLAYMENRIRYHPKITYQAPKMVMDCGHDTTVGPIARFMSNAFNIPYHKFCDFACNVYYELYREYDGDYTVDYYMDDELLIHKLNYYEFKKIMMANFWNDTFADQFCGKEKDTYVNAKNWAQDHSNFLLALFIVMTFLFVIFLTSALLMFRRYRIFKKKIAENPLLNIEMQTTNIPILN